MENLAKNSMSRVEATNFLIQLCGSDSFGKQLQQECIGRLDEVGYPVSKGEFGARSTRFVNDFNKSSLTNHYKAILRTYE